MERLGRENQDASDCRCDRRSGFGQALLQRDRGIAGDEERMGKPAEQNSRELEKLTETRA